MHNTLGLLHSNIVTIKKSTNLNTKWGKDTKLDDTLEMELILKETAVLDGVESVLIPWQKKIFGKREIDFYGVERNCNSFLDHKYHDLVTNLDANDVVKYIYTLTDSDYKSSTCKNYVDPEEITQELSDDNSNVRNRKDGKSRKSEIKSRPSFLPELEFTRCKACLKGSSNHKMMFIMADLDPNEYSEQVIIAVLHAEENGILSISPDLNSHGKPYIVQNGKLETFEFRLENASEEMSKTEKDKEIEESKEIREKHSRYLKSCVGTEFEMPNHDVLKLHLMGEIIEASHFGNKNLFVYYIVDLPAGWSVSDTNWLSGTTQTSKPVTRNKIYTSSFGFPIEGNFQFETTKLDSDDCVLKWPVLLVEISSKDFWGCVRTEGYGFVEIPNQPGCHEVEIMTWKPVSNSPISQLRNHFIGNVHEIEDLSFVNVPNTLQDKEFSRLGFRTESSGILKIKLNILHQSQSFLVMNERKNILSKLNALRSQNSIQAVLTSFQRARHKMLAARDNVLHGGKKLAD